VGKAPSSVSLSPETAGGRLVDDEELKTAISEARAGRGPGPSSWPFCGALSPLNVFFSFLNGLYCRDNHGLDWTGPDRTGHGYALSSDGLIQ
jgi:hypothetical protein